MRERKIINDDGRDIMIQVRIRSEDKEEFHAICAELMLNASEVLRAMIDKFVKEGKIDGEIDS